MNNKLLFQILLVLFAISCKPTEEPPVVVPDTLVLSLSDVEFTSEKDACLLKVTTEKEWTATTDADWISLSASSGDGETAFLIGASENKWFSRTAQVTIRAGELSKEITISQAGSSIINFTVNNVSFNMVLVKGSQFIMGDTENSGFGLAHQVKLDDYYIMETEVTNELWKAVLNSLPYENQLPLLPVSETTWTGISTNFIPEFNRLSGKNFRLPTEAEWEYAAMGGIKTHSYKYAGSNTLDDVAWYSQNSGNTKHAVKSKQSNELGLYDMSGNVSEWCSDWYDLYYGFSIVNNTVITPELQTNPTGPASGTKKIIRGGSFENDESWGFSYCNVKYRYSVHPSGYETSDYNSTSYFLSKNTGFRLVLVP